MGGHHRDDDASLARVRQKCRWWTWVALGCVVICAFIGIDAHPKAQIRDHSNIARAYVALGQAGIEDVNGLIVKEAHRFGFVDEGVISADTTAQE
ncbi:hypothetical protein C2W62_30625, partial [Candidatus Entotheonella serta]